MNRECYGFERAFFTLKRFLPYTPSCWFPDLPRAGCSTSKLAGLHADLRNIAPAQLFVWITTIHKTVILAGLFKAYGWSADEESAPLGSWTLFTTSWACQKPHALFVRPQSHTVYNKLRPKYVEKLLAEILASTYDFAVNIVMVINITINKTFSIYDLIKNYFQKLFFKNY